MEILLWAKRPWIFERTKDDTQVRRISMEWLLIGLHCCRNYSSQLKTCWCSNALLCKHSKKSHTFAKFITICWVCIQIKRKLWRFNSFMNVNVFKFPRKLWLHCSNYASYVNVIFSTNNIRNHDAQNECQRVHKLILLMLYTPNKVRSGVLGTIQFFYFASKMLLFFSIRFVSIKSTRILLIQSISPFPRIELSSPWRWCQR